MDNQNPSGQKPKVKVERRRRASPEEAAGKPRAAAPQRSEQRAQPSGGYTPSGMGGAQTPSGAGGLPLKSLLPLLKRLPWWVVLCLAVAFIAYIVFTMRGNGGLQEVAYIEPTQAEEVYTPSPTATRRPTSVPVVGASGKQIWLVMLYQDADDKILEQDIYVDLNEAERAGSNDSLHIVAQVDRFSAGFQGDGNWTSTKRFYITQDDDLSRVNSEVIADLGEVNMSDARSLVDFVIWAVENYPANHYGLILSDHGMGWPGGWSDASSAGRGDSSTPLASALGDQIYLNELDQALEEIRAQTGIEKFDLIGMDACLMGHLEVFSALESHAHYAVASQETEPALGWAYTSFLSELKADPGMDGGTLGQLIVESYIQDDQRIVDDQARAEFLRQGSPMGGLFGFLGSMSASQVTQQLEQTITLTAVDLTALPELQNSMNDLAFLMQNVDQGQIAQARTYAQSFTSIFGKDVPPSYIDLGNFVQLLQRDSRDAQVSQAARSVLTTIDQVVVVEKHGPKKPGATGISIYFPNQILYRNPAAGAQSYTVIAEKFAQQSLWDEFLAYHYGGRSFEREEVGVLALDPGNVTRAPGKGQIEISPISLSATEAAQGSPVVISADIAGENIGYVKLFVGYYDPGSNSIFIADMDYLESSETRELDGVYYPVWPDAQEFTLEFSWEPVVFAINDGVNSIPVLFTPETYGATFEEAIYTVDGLYTYADEGQTYNARLYFSDGILRNVYGFTNENATGAPREIIPQPGDTFTVLEKWMDLNQNGQVTQTSEEEGSVLTFGSQPFTWETLYAAEGEYIVGFVVEDLDGNAYQSFGQVSVR